MGGISFYTTEEVQTHEHTHTQYVENIDYVKSVDDPAACLAVWWLSSSDGTN